MTSTPKSDSPAEYVRPPRPKLTLHFPRTPWSISTPPDLPSVKGMDPETASTTYSHYRTGLSNHRTGLSEHRTELSEHRTDLSEHRTDLSEYRTALSDHRTDLSEGRTELSMRRTGMSFQRTRLSADRTLMSVIRTSLSLISFGFTIFQFFQKLEQGKVFTHVAAPRNFGLALVFLGMAMLVVGIAYHLQFMIALREERKHLRAEGLVHGESPFPPSMTLITALLLLALGIGAFVSMAFNVGPFR